MIDHGQFATGSLWQVMCSDSEGYEGLLATARRGQGRSTEGFTLQLPIGSSLMLLGPARRSIGTYEFLFGDKRIFIHRSRLGRGRAVEPTSYAMLETTIRCKVDSTIDRLIK